MIAHYAAVKILLVNPPVASPIGPYPAICYLAGFLKTIGREAELADASLELLLRLFTPHGIQALADAAGSAPPDPIVEAFVARAGQYASTIETAVACLQGRDVGALARASRAPFFPPPIHAARDWAFSTYYTSRTYEARLGVLSDAQRRRLLASVGDSHIAFGRAGKTDEVRFKASNLLDDVCQVIRRVLAPDFELDAYDEHLSDDAGTFEPIRAELTRPPHFIDRMIDDIAAELSARHRPDLVGFSVPFAGNLVGALRMAAAMKRQNPNVTIVMGGGWINTQLRELTDPGIFDYVDFITLDDGERPLERLIAVLEQQRDASQLVRTFHRVEGRVVFTNAPAADVPFADTGTPTYRGLPTDQYLAIRRSVQSFQRIAGARWNKLTLAHGCYWKRCAFCDTSLDYIGRYDPASVEVTIARIRALIDETGETGFHFVDEAMPPAAMARLAERLIAERITISWWGNVRFDAAIIPMAPLLAESGCIGITGGLEVASDRVLALMDKGITLAQAARVCHALASQDIFTHAYLIYGFPTETLQETVDALDFVRQLFKNGCLNSAIWHLFELTLHSPIARNPERFGITVRPRATRPFSNMMMHFDEPGRIDHATLGPGLARALDHYTLGLALDDPATRWFDAPVPSSTLAPDFVQSLIATP